MPQAIHTLAEGSFFSMPWREGNVGSHGQLLHISDSSVRVRVYDYQNFTWETTTWSRGTMIEPADEASFRGQRLSGEDNKIGSRANRERSAVESPVEIVHNLCSSLFNDHGREFTKEFRDAVVKAAVEAGVNISTAKTQYYAWRKKMS